MLSKSRLCGLLLATFLFLLLLPVQSQNPPVEVKRSTEKVLLDGRVYLIHVVKPGQTLFGICQAYGIDRESLVKENPSVLVGLQAGQVLKIPEAHKKAAPAHDTLKYIYHTIAEGETLYSLSKKYGVSVEEIEAANFGLDISDIPLGAEIQIPRIVFHEEPQGFPVRDGKYFYYQVKQGETIASVARKFGIEFRTLRRLNRDKRRGLNVGDYLRIPRTPATELYFIEIPDTTRIMARQPDTLCLTPVPDHLDTTIKVALMLPLFLDENDEREYIDSSEISPLGDTIYKTIKRDKNWIYPKSVRFLDFYEGAMLAIDSLRKRGLSTDLYVYDTGQDTAKVKEIVQFGLLDEMDIIVGPVYSSSIQIVTDYLTQHELRIPVVSPFVQNESLLDNYPSLFEVRPAHKEEEAFIAGVVSADFNDNIVLIRPADSLYIDEVNSFKNQLLDSLEQRTLPENIIFKELAYQENRPLYDTVQEIEHTLSEEKNNVVVVLSQKETFVSEVLSRLFRLSKNYHLNVYGFPEWARFNNIQLNYFHDLQVYYCSSYYLDYENRDVQNFLRKYRLKFKTEPTPYSFTWTGYDIMFYFLTGMAAYGPQFMHCYPWFHAQMLTTGFEFLSAGEGKGALNTKLFLLQFTKDMKLVKRPLPVPVVTLDHSLTDSIKGNQEISSQPGKE